MRLLNPFRLCLIGDAVLDITDFTRSPNPTARSFYCSMFNDQITPVTGYFNRHNWYFYTLNDNSSIDDVTKVCVDQNW